MDKSSEYNLYRDIQSRTGGEIYLGVVGPVRTGKSTFIKRFMDLCVLPGIEDEHARTRARDELPQSAAGKTIMTTEPKFIPKETAAVRISDDVEVRVRLIDCVGFMAEGAAGHVENGEERLLAALKKNEECGVLYHYDGQLTGDYDLFHRKEEIIAFLEREL